MLGRGLGATIDSFENVLRFHEQLPYIREHQEDVGKKTTILAGNGNTQSLCRLSKRLSKKQRGVKKLILVSNSNDPTDEIKSDKHGDRVLRFAEIWRLPVKLLGGTSVATDFNIKPTSGLVILLHMLEKYDLLHLCGFNFLVGNNCHEHFYDSEPMKLGHDLVAETGIIKRIADKTGRINILGQT